MARSPVQGRRSRAPGSRKAVQARPPPGSRAIRMRPPRAARSGSLAGRVEEAQVDGVGALRENTAKLVPGAVPGCSERVRVARADALGMSGRLHGARALPSRPVLRKGRARPLGAGTAWLSLAPWPPEGALGPVPEPTVPSPPPLPSPHRCRRRHRCRRHHRRCHRRPGRLARATSGRHAHGLTLAAALWYGLTWTAICGFSATSGTS